MQNKKQATLTPAASRLRIIFMGTPAFAVASLEALLQAGFNVVGVITAPDKPAGRGMELQQSAVKKAALVHGLPVLQPLKLKDPGFIDDLKALKADLQVVVAFRMLPEVVWNMPPLGTINVHASLLPHYRGAAPINWAVINGEKETGITTFKLQHAIDTGNILLQEKLAIGSNETAGELHDRMMAIGASLLVETVNGIANDSIHEQPQDSFNLAENEIKHAPKIYTETCQINWKQPVEKIYNQVRGLSPYPTAFTKLDGKTLKIFSGKIENQHPTETPGNYKTDGKSFLKFAAPDGYLHVTELQLEGKKRMDVESFLRGHRFTG
jgi:methionyl-tRNA formyltransferase